MDLDFSGNVFIHFSLHFSLQFSPSLFTSLICQKSELFSSEFTQNSLCGAPQGGDCPEAGPSTMVASAGMRSDVLADGEKRQFAPPRGFSRLAGCVEDGKNGFV